MSSPEDIIVHAFHTIRDTFSHAATVLDSQIDNLASSIRDHLAHSTWVPKGYRPASPPPPPVVSPPASLASIILSPTRLYRSTAEWASRHKFLLTTIAATLALGTTYSTHRYLRRNRRKLGGLKRRAARTSNGSRTQVVVLAGYPYEQTTSLLALDLEKRGFIVYITVSTQDEERAVSTGVASGRPDVHPLLIDIADPTAQIERFTSYLLSPQTPFHPSSGPTHYLSLVGLVVVPTLASYAAAPVEVLGGEVWADSININLLQPIVIAKSFLRVLALFKSRIVVLQSVIVPSLAPPFCALETVIGRSLEGFTSVLEREVSPFGIGVSIIKVGNVEGIVGSHSSSPSHHHPFRTPSPLSSGQSSRMRTPSPGSVPLPPGVLRADVLSWPASLRATYARQFISSLSSNPSSVGSSTGSAIKGAPVRDLYIAVFDALYGGGSGVSGVGAPGKGRFVYRVGTGSTVYEALSEWLPRGVVGWMLGVGGFGSASGNTGAGHWRGGLLRNSGEPEGTGKERARDGGSGGADGSTGAGATAAEWEKVERMV